MPVTCKLRDGKYRIVEPSGKIAKNKSGTAVDGGGHTTKEQCQKQARAINSAQDTAPLNACTFSEGCEVSFAEKTEAQKDNTFQIIAYSGQIIPNHWFWGNVAFDLEGIKFDKKKTPVLDFHSIGNRLGFTTKQDIKDKVIVEGKFLSNTKAQEIKQDMVEGFPMQASVYLPPDKIEFVREGDTVEVNGHTLKGPGAIFRKAKIKDVIICALGYDSNTQAKVFAEGGDQKVQFSVLEKENIMPATETKIESAEMFAADYPDLHKEIVTAAKAEGVTEGKAEGEKSVRELFGKFAEKFGDDPALCVEQFKAGSTIEAATAAQNEKLRAKNKELAEKANKQSQANVDPAHQEFSDQQTEGNETPDETKPAKERYTDEFKKSADIQAEFKDNLDAYIAFRENEDAGRVKITGR